MVYILVMITILHHIIFLLHKMVETYAMAAFNSLVNYPAQRLCLGSNVFAYLKDLLYVFDIEIICLMYIKIYDDCCMVYTFLWLPTILQNYDEI